MRYSICEVCARSFTSMRPARTCSNACRQRAFRERAALREAALLAEARTSAALLTSLGAALAPAED
ncbi:hypothetical protein [Nocardioides houyundeii]|uniref:hypothetical protein n=1 Tax=Nocardioides houyundeii TaxID=2045452 RepID=UPI000C770F6B|nr:hypothetical protein [Nocardioides houyundeii]